MQSVCHEFIFGQRERLFVNRNGGRSRSCAKKVKFHPSFLANDGSPPRSTSPPQIDRYSGRRTKVRGELEFIVGGVGKEKSW